MRKTVTTTLLAAGLLLCAAAPGVAKKSSKHRPKRVGSHVSLHVSGHNVVRGRRVVLHGRVRPRGSRRVKIVVRGPGGAVRGTTSGRGGGFRLRWRPQRLGAYEIRAYGRHSGRLRAARSPARRVTAYRHAEASYYGPGLYGGGMACGGTLTPGTLGVAHKSLPCGSRVKLRYRGRQVTVPVVDRGPYVAGRDYDLTAATKARLGFPGSGVLLSSR
jgi:rare lipoprotein A